MVVVPLYGSKPRSFGSVVVMASAAVVRYEVYNLTANAKASLKLETKAPLTR